MKMNIFTLLLVMTTAAASQASPTHMFHCAVGSQENRKSMSLEIEDSDLESGMGTLTLSLWTKPENSGPEASGVSRWVPFQKATVSMELEWALSPVTSQKVITGAKVNMGRSGAITVTSTENPSQFGSVKAELNANAMDFNFPQGVEAKCSYFYAAGPKPGLTGSN